MGKIVDQEPILEAQIQHKREIGHIHMNTLRCLQARANLLQLSRTFAELFGLPGRITELSSRPYP